MTCDVTRLGLAFACLLAYVFLCLLIYLPRWRKRPAAHTAKQQTPCLIAYASQTGNAEALAQHSAACLALAGIAQQVLPLAEVQASHLQQAERILFIVSTYGEGDTPDNAAQFADQILTSSLHLPQLHYAVLALGDASYRHFCGFGRALDTWLQAQGAQAIHQRIEVNQLDASAITRWQQLLSHLAGTDDAPDWRAPPFSAWRLHHRQQLNLGSDSAPIYHLELRPADGALPSWQAGDLAQIKLSPDAMNQADQISETIERDYSIASIPENGSVQLLVRLQTRENGEFGLASGHLTQRLAIGDTIQLRLRAHPRFQIGANQQRPLILIGNGSGMAGLRSHLLARAQARAGPNWLIFGERHAATDFYYRTEIEAWRASGVLQQLDMVFSRDQAEKRYVQDRLREVADLLQEWIERDAAIYVCGSLQTMAGGVHQALLEVLGEAGLSLLADSGRYQRDVY